MLIRQIEVAARAGGGDIESNATLRTMIGKARDNSVPLDTIQRAIKRGTGEEEGVVYEQVSYEGYAPGGVAVIVQALTDNRNRTSAEIKNLFSRNGGSFAEPGAVSWQFERKGIVNVDKSVDEDELMLVAADAGADDVEDGGDAWQVTTPPTDLHAVRTAIEKSGRTSSSWKAGQTMLTRVFAPDIRHSRDWVGSGGDGRRDRGAVGPGRARPAAGQAAEAFAKQQQRGQRIERVRPVPSVRQRRQHGTAHEDADNELHDDSRRFGHRPRPIRPFSYGVQENFARDVRSARAE